MKIQKGRLSQGLSVVMSAAMVASSLSLADVARAEVGMTASLAFAERLAIPRSLGTVTDVSLPNTATPAPTVVLIQDLHLHYPTQKRIIKILDHLYTKNLVSGPVAVEGVQGVYDTSKIASYPAGKIKTELVDYFMKKGELSGDEAFSILRGDGKLLYGVDSADYYGLDRDLFKATLSHRKTLGAQLARVQDGLNYLKKSHRHETSTFTENVQQASDRVEKLQKLLRQEVTLNEARFIAQRLPAFVETTGKLLEEKDTRDLQETIKAAVDFYIVALMRDKPLAANTLSLLKENPSIALVAGGFHTAGLTAAFKKAGVGYAVITPNIDTLPDAAYRELYEKRLLGQSISSQEMASDFHVNPTMVVVRANAIFDLWPVAWRWASLRHFDWRGMIARKLSFMEMPNQTSPRRSMQRGSWPTGSANNATEVSISENDLKVQIAFGTSGWRGLLVPQGTTFEDGTALPKGSDGFTIENVSRVAQAIAEVVQEDADYKEGLPVGVGYDARPGAREFAVRVVEVLVANGIRVRFFDDIMPTPVTAEKSRKSLAADKRIAIGIHLTASHNPVYFTFKALLTYLQEKFIGAKWMGVKIMKGGTPANDAYTGKIAARANDPSKNGSYRYANLEGVALAALRDDAINESNLRLAKAFNFADPKNGLIAKLNKLHEAGQLNLILWNVLHGGTTLQVQRLVRLMQEMGLKVSSEVMNPKPMSAGSSDDIEGGYPTTVTEKGVQVPWGPEPRPVMYKAAMESKMKPGVMAGIFDGDGDRAEIYDIDGKTTLSPNELGVLFAHFLITTGKVKGDNLSLVRTLPTTRNLDILAKRFGLPLNQTPVGSKHFESHLDTLVTATEESGHLFFRLGDEVFVDSAVGEFLLGLMIAAETGKSLKKYYDEDVVSDLKKAGSPLIYNRTAVDSAYVTNDFKDGLKLLRTEHPQDFAEKLSQKLQKSISKVDSTTDSSGILVEFSDGSWAMYRLSGTDGSVRIYGEETSPKKLKLQEEVVQQSLLELAPRKIGGGSSGGIATPASSQLRIFVPNRGDVVLNIGPNATVESVKRNLGNHGLPASGFELAIAASNQILGNTEQIPPSVALQVVYRVGGGSSGGVATPGSKGEPHKVPTADDVAHAREVIEGKFGPVYSEVKAMELLANPEQAHEEDIEHLKELVNAYQVVRRNRTEKVRQMGISSSEAELKGLVSALKSLSTISPDHQALATLASSLAGKSPDVVTGILSGVLGHLEKLSVQPTVQDAFLNVLEHFQRPPLYIEEIKHRVQSAIGEEIPAGSRLFWPVRDFMGGASLESIVPTRTADEALQILKSASTPLTIEGHLRGVDGAGSSLDLPEFQRALTPEGGKKLADVTSTPTIASEFSAKVRIELAEDPDVIEYVAPDYNIHPEHPYRIKGPVALTPKGQTPKGQLDAPAFIFNNLFHLKGIRIVLENIDAMAQAGGMESSNVFNVALISAASMLSGADLSQAEIFNLAVRLENNEFNGLTGGQGHLSTLTGGVYRHVWLSGKVDHEGRLPYGSLSIPLASDDQFKEIESHMALVQAGKDYQNGQALVGRTASSINKMWTDLLRDKDRVGLPLHQEKLALADRYTRAIAQGDYGTIVEVISRYVEIRDLITQRWLNLMIDAKQQKTQDTDGKSVPAYAQRYVTKVFAESSRGFDNDFALVRELFEKDPEALRANSLYTFEPIASLVKAGREEGVAIMPLGAGGPGANLIAISSEGQEHLVSFLAKHQLHQLTEKEARAAMTEEGHHTLKGFVPFRVGSEPLQMKGFQELGLSLPKGPIEMGVHPSASDVHEAEYDPVPFIHLLTAAERDQLADRLHVFDPTQKGHLIDSIASGDAHSHFSQENQSQFDQFIDGARTNPVTSLERKALDYRTGHHSSRAGISLFGIYGLIASAGATALAYFSHVIAAISPAHLTDVAARTTIALPEWAPIAVIGLAFAVLTGLAYQSYREHALRLEQTKTEASRLGRLLMAWGSFPALVKTAVWATAGVALTVVIAHMPGHHYRPEDYAVSAAVLGAA